MDLPDVHMPRHIVAATALVTDGHQGQILLVRHPRRGWEFPGGQVEEGEDLIVALQREVREEAGVEVAVGRLAAVYASLRSHIVILGFLAEYVSGELQGSPESPELGWYPRERVLEMITHPALHDRARDMLEFDGCVTYRAYTTDPYAVCCERVL